MPKYLGKTAYGFIIELSTAECRAIGLESKYERGEQHLLSKDNLPNVVDLRAMLNSIVRACPQLKTARAAMQSFLLLTEPQTVIDAAENCGTEIRFEEPEAKPASRDELDELLRNMSQNTQESLEALRKLVERNAEPEA